MRFVAERLRSVKPDDYRTAIPFPHCVIENLIPKDRAEEIAGDFPPVDWERWKLHRHKNSEKLASKSIEDCPLSVWKLLCDLNSMEVVAAISGILGTQVQADPNYQGGGMHLIPRGGFLGMHADFNLTDDGRRLRVANLLVYLNECDGTGDLILRHRAGYPTKSGCPTKFVSPAPGRAVLFTTYEDHLHGHPTPLKGDRNRMSIATYYYVPAPKGTVPHSTLYQ